MKTSQCVAEADFLETKTNHMELWFVQIGCIDIMRDKSETLEERMEALDRFRNIHSRIHH